MFLKLAKKYNNNLPHQSKYLFIAKIGPPQPRKAMKGGFIRRLFTKNEHAGGGGEQSLHRGLPHMQTNKAKNPCPTKLRIWRGKIFKVNLGIRNIRSPLPRLQVSPDSTHGNSCTRASGAEG